MKTLQDLYKENPKEYKRMVSIANREHRKLFVENDKLTLSEPNFHQKDYVIYRKENYPRLQEQLDMLWHAIDEGKLDKTSKFYTTLKEIKDKFPKTLVYPVEETEETPEQ